MARHALVGALLDEVTRNLARIDGLRRGDIRAARLCLGYKVDRLAPGGCEETSAKEEPHG